MHNVQSTNDSRVHRERRRDISKWSLLVLSELATSTGSCAGPASISSVAVQTGAELATYVQVSDLV